MYSDAAPSTLRNHALALVFIAIYLGIALSLEPSARFMQYSRWNNTPPRPGRLGPLPRSARWGLPARSARLGLRHLHAAGKKNIPPRGYVRRRRGPAPMVRIIRVEWHASRTQ
eukprot:36061-Pyramimonas_sp.AAC.1